MKRRFPSDAPPFDWRRQRTRWGVEYLFYPDALAREHLLYPVALGRSRTPPGNVFDHVVKDYYLLHYVEQGALWHVIRNRRYIVREGEACLMDVTETISHGADGDQPAVSDWVAFNGRDMPRMYCELSADQNPVFAGLDCKAIKRLFRDLRHIAVRNAPACALRTSGLLTLILAELYAVRARERPMIHLGTSTQTYSEPVRRGIDWIVRYYDEPYSLKEMCAAIHVSRSHFTRRFHRETGVPPIAWLNRYRIEQAERLLFTTAKPVSEIAAAVGISNANYFSRKFRAVTGCSPCAFRKSRNADVAPRDRSRNQLAANPALRVPKSKSTTKENHALST